MEEEIDLREYVRVLINSWRLIAGVTLVAVAVAAVVSLLQPTVYEATATVAGQKPAGPADATLAQMAVDDELLEDLAASLSPISGMEKVGDLRAMLKATAGADATVAQLKVRSQDAQEAARIANGWAVALVPYANERYREAREVQAELLEGQAEQSLAQLAQAEQALVEFDGQSPAMVLAARRDAAQRELGERLAEQGRIAWATESARELQARLAARPADAQVRPAEGLAAMMLQAQLAGHDSPVQLQLSEGVALLAGQSAGELAAFLDQLVADLAARSEGLDARIAALEPQLLELQRQAQEADLARERVLLDKDVAQEVYVSLAQRAGEARAAAASSDLAKISTPAAVPQAPAGRSWLVNVAMAGVLGLMLGVFGAFAVEWWRGGAQGEDKSQA